MQCMEGVGGTETQEGLAASWKTALTLVGPLTLCLVGAAQKHKWNLKIGALSLFNAKDPLWMARDSTWAAPALEPESVANSKKWKGLQESREASSGKAMLCTFPGHSFHGPRHSHWLASATWVPTAPPRKLTASW